MFIGDGLITCALFEQLSSRVGDRLRGSLHDIFQRIFEQKERSVQDIKETAWCPGHKPPGTFIVKSRLLLGVGCLPLSGMMSLQGRAKGVIECWQTSAVKLPGRQYH